MTFIYLSLGPQNSAILTPSREASFVGCVCVCVVGQVLKRTITGQNAEASNCGMECPFPIYISTAYSLILFNSQSFLIFIYYSLI